MKVGVYLGQMAPDVGGGYTFQNEIFRSFVQQASASRHTYCVICDDAFVRHFQADVSGIANIEVAGLPKVGLIERIRTRLKTGSAFAREHLIAAGPLGRLAAKHGIEMMWCLSAGPVLLDIPYVTVVWDLQHRLQPWFPEVSAKGQWDLRESSYSWFLRRAAIVVTGNEAGREEIHSFYQVPKERIRLLPHPTPEFALSPPREETAPGDIRNRYNITGEFIFYPAQFWAHKNHANLLLAVSQLRRQREIRLDVVFSGSDKGNRAHIEDLAKSLGLDGAVRFLGFIPQQDLIELYRHAVALTYVSFFGPENLPPLEAFALGCPVVASKVSGSRQQLGDAALLVDPKDPEEIAEAIEAIYRDDTLKKQLIAAGRARAQHWRAIDFVNGVFKILDDFEPVRRCWSR